MRYVIIGNSAAGIAAVEGIRQIDREGEITVVTDENYHTYSRPLISYLLRGKVTREGMNYRGENFYNDNNCRLRLQTRVDKIDADKKCAILSDGESVPYDKLLVATGSSAFVPPFEGLDTVENKHCFMSMDDAIELNDTLDESSRVLIIGAGLIGLKCAEGIAERVSHITVVDLAPRILSSILDIDGANRVQTHLESCGIEFKLASVVKRFDGNSAVIECENNEQNQKVIEFDALVIAVGVRPNTELLKDIALIDKGIVVNVKSETTVPDIYAAGDCAQTFDISSGDSKIMAVLPNAYMQGECAGINMAGGEKVFDKAMPMNAIGFFGMHMITAGTYSGEIVAFEDSDCYRRFFFGDNRLNGFILIGDVAKAGIYTNLIRERTPLDTIDFSLICEKPGLMAFRKDERIIKLGGGAI